MSIDDSIIANLVVDLRRARENSDAEAQDLAEINGCLNALKRLSLSNSLEQKRDNRVSQ